MRGLGTIINVVTVLAGTGFGLAIGPRLPDRIRTTLLQGVALVTIVLGVSQALETRNLIFPLVAIVLGGLAGELARLEERVEALGEWLRRRFAPDPDAPPVRTDIEVEGAPADQPAARPSTFVEGFVAASLVFCVGPLTVLGSIQDGLSGDIELLAVKAALDGLVAIVFASTLGIGVGFSALTVLAYQGALTFGAGAVDTVLTQRMIAEATAAGGVMVLGIGVRLLELRRIRVAAFLPGLVFAPVLVALFAR